MQACELRRTFLHLFAASFAFLLLLLQLCSFDRIPLPYRRHRMMQRTADRTGRPFLQLTGQQTGLPIEKLLFQLLITLLFPLIVLFIRLIAFLFLQDLLTALPQLLRLCLL